MSLTSFVNLYQVREKFKTEFKSVLNNSYKINFYRSSQNKENIRKDIVGIYFGIFEGYVKFYDSFNRKKNISTIEDLISFLTYSKYRNNLCWYYDDSFNLRLILKNLFAKKFEDLEKFGTIEYYAYTIEYEEKKYFHVKNNRNTQIYKFYNLYPFRSNLDPESILYLNQQIRMCHNINNLTNIDNWDNSIIECCIENAKLIKNMANYYGENEDKIESNLRKKIINNPKTSNHSSQGTAFDYLLRFLIRAHNPTAVTRPWIAYGSLNILKGREKKLAVSIINDAEDRYSLFLKEKEINDEVISSTILLAKLDLVARKIECLDDIQMNVDPDDIVDLKNLIEGVPSEMYISKENCFLNPTFGLASYLVGGADADLLIDNTLIDIKTTKEQKFSSLHFNQLMGYVILHSLGRIYSNNTNKVDPHGLFSQGMNFDIEFLNTRIEKIGVYFSRFNHFQTINIKDIIPDGEIDWKLLAWFEAEAQKEFKPYEFKKYFRKSKVKELTKKDISLD